jgi:hypothetical protein
MPTCSVSALAFYHPPIRVSNRHWPTHRSFPMPSLNFLKRPPPATANSAAISRVLLMWRFAPLLRTKFKFLKAFITDNLDTLALREVFLHLVADHPDGFGVSSDLFRELSFRARENSRKALLVLLTMRDCLKEKRRLSVLFEDATTLLNLSAIGMEAYESDPMKSGVAYSVLNLVLGESVNVVLGEVRGRFASAFGVCQRINCATAAAVRLFPSSIEYFITSFFACELPTAVNEEICSAIGRMPYRQLQEFTTKHHLNFQILERFDGYLSNKTNGHFFSIGTLLIHQGLVCCSGHRDAWESFVRNAFQSHAALVIASYGRSCAAVPARPHCVVRRGASPRTLSQSVVSEGI